MRHPATLTLLAASMLSPSQLSAANLTATHAQNEQRPGAFAGARIRMPLGGRDAAKPKAGLVLAPTLTATSRTGEKRLQFGDGIEFGMSAGKPPALHLAGVPVGSETATEPKLGVSTLGWIAIGVGVAAIGYAAWAYKELSEPHD